MTASGDNLASNSKSRRLPTRAQGVTLLGMVLTIGSLFLAWERISLTPEQRMLPTYYSATNITNTGLQTAAHWPLTLCAIACGLSLLWTPAGNARLPLLFTQGLGGMFCLLIPLRQFVQSGYAPLPGVIVGMFGGSLLLFGAFDRATVPSQPIS